MPLLNLPSGFINSVAINDFGQGLIAGSSVNATAYAALVSSTMLTPIFLNLPVTSVINSVAIMNLFGNIPTTGIRGNSLKFANYINAYAPQDAFYFVPALFDGTLAAALESAAPTRNAISFNTVMQNAFYLTTTLSTHLRDQHFMRKRGVPQKETSSTPLSAAEMPSEDQLLASLALAAKKTNANQMPDKNANSYTVWVDAIGAFASQDAQHQRRV